MSCWINGVRCNSFGHHFLQCDTLSMMFLSLICGVRYYWFKVSNVFPFVKGEVFISVIGDENFDWHLVLDLVNAISYLNVGVSTLGCAVICDKMCCMCGDGQATNPNQYYIIVPRWYLKGWFYSANSGFLGVGMCKSQIFSILLYKTLFVLIPSIR